MAKLCPSCGFENEDNAKFCKKCGTGLQSTTKSVNDTVNQKSSNNTLIIGSIVIICLVIVGAIVLFNNGTSENIDSQTMDSEADVAVQQEDYGLSFDDACSEFPEASTTVVGHVFDESDADGDGYLNDEEYSTFEDVKDFTKRWAVDITNDDEVDTPDLWNGDGTIRTRYCADHGRVVVDDEDLCPYCIAKNYDDPRTRKDSTKYI